MKHYCFAALSILLLLTVVACKAEPTSEANIEATVQAAVEATLAHWNASAQQTASARPTDTPVPDTEAMVAAAVEATLTAVPDVAEASDRLYRPYPAPTGYPGFRKYYQKRCYPGCHYDVGAGTPTPQAVHP